MTVTVSTIYLLDVASNEGTPGELRDAIEETQLADWKMYWRPELAKILKELKRRGVPPNQWPQSWHWNWAEKLAYVDGLLAFRSFCVVANGVTQGLALFDLTKSGRHASHRGKPLVYIDFLEVAPWNRSDIGGQPRLRGVGNALLSAAVQLSIDEGFMGRIGLHSLPQADSFYLRCGMESLGPDPRYQDLCYFEMTAAQAREFLERE